MVTEKGEDTNERMNEKRLVRTRDPCRGTLGLFIRANSHILMPAKTPTARLAPTTAPRVSTRTPGPPTSASASQDRRDERRCSPTNLRFRLRALRSRSVVQLRV